jgi:CPA1 family monovalent cation:H+ antiporter
LPENRSLRSGFRSISMPDDPCSAFVRQREPGGAKPATGNRQPATSNQQPATMNETQFTITVFISLLLVASGVAMASKWVRVPYTLMLVIVGLVISPMHFLPPIHISPELILLIFLPALLFEAAWNLRLDHLRENLAPIVVLSILGVGLSTGVIGLILHLGIGLPLSSAMLFGAMISATDPVSVLALFKKLGLPKRLGIIVEGESLFNDGTAVVVFRIILGVVIGATADSPGALALHSLREFGLVVFGGLAIGATIGLIASTLTSYFDDHLLEITLTTIVAYGSFLLAEGLHVSPVIAVLAAGLVLGNYGRRVGMSPTTQVAVNSFWEYAAFVVNSLVFLLIGLEVQVPLLVENFTAIAWAVASMLAGRFAGVYVLIPLTNRFSEPVPVRWQHVLYWGGLRGSLSMALVLSLPVDLPHRSLLVLMIFGSVMFSLLAQGLTITPLLRALKLTRIEPGLKEYEVLHGRLLAETAALAELDTLRKEGSVTADLYGSLKESLTRSHEELAGQLVQFEQAEQVRSRQRRRVESHLLHVRKARLGELLHEGLISEESVAELNRKLDEELASKSPEH